MYSYIHSVSDVLLYIPDVLLYIIIHYTTTAAPRATRAPREAERPLLLSGRDFRRLSSMSSQICIRARVLQIPAWLPTLVARPVSRWPTGSRPTHVSAPVWAAVLRGTQRASAQRAAGAFACGCAFPEERVQGRRQANHPREEDGNQLPQSASTVRLQRRQLQQIPLLAASP